MDRVKAFGAAVRARRRELSLTQEQLAERVGLHINHISFIERGLTNAALDIVFSLADALKMRASELVASAEGVTKQRKRMKC